MAGSSSPMTLVQRRLTRYLDRLRHNLDAVSEQVREALAQVVGRSVAEAVGEAVYDALLPHHSPATTRPRSVHRSAERSALPPRDWDPPAWQREADDTLWSHPYTADDDDDFPHARATPEPDEPSSGPDALHSIRWHPALAAGVQAAAWWLRRQRRPASLGAAFTVGAIAALLVLVGPAQKTTTLAASVLSLASLYQLVCSASHLLATNVSFAPPRT